MDRGFLQNVGEIQKELSSNSNLQVIRRHVSKMMTAFEEGRSLPKAEAIVFFRCIVQPLGVRLLMRADTLSSTMAHMVEWFVGRLPPETRQEMRDQVLTLIRHKKIYKMNNLGVGDVIKATQKKELIAARPESRCEEDDAAYIAAILDAPGEGPERDSAVRLLKWIVKTSRSADEGGSGGSCTSHQRFCQEIAGCDGLVALFMNSLVITKVQPSSLNAQGKDCFAAQTEFKVEWSDGAEEKSRNGKVGPRERCDSIIYEILRTCDAEGITAFFRSAVAISAVTDTDFASAQMVDLFKFLIDNKRGDALACFVRAVRSSPECDLSRVNSVCDVLLLNLESNQATGAWWYQHSADLILTFSQQITASDAHRVMDAFLRALSAARRGDCDSAWAVERLALMSMYLANCCVDDAIRRVEMRHLELLYSLRERLEGFCVDSPIEERYEKMNWAFCARNITMNVSRLSTKPILRPVLQLCLETGCNPEAMEIFRSVADERMTNIWMEASQPECFAVLANVLNNCDMSDFDVGLRLLEKALQTKMGRYRLAKALDEPPAVRLIGRLCSHADQHDGEDGTVVAAVLAGATFNVHDAKVQVAERLATSWLTRVLSIVPGDVGFFLECLRLLVFNKGQENSQGNGLIDFVAKIVEQTTPGPLQRNDDLFLNLPRALEEDDLRDGLGEVLEKHVPELLGLIGDDAETDVGQAAIRLLAVAMEFQEDSQLLQDLYAPGAKGATLTPLKATDNTDNQHARIQFFTLGTDAECCNPASSMTAPQDLQKAAIVLRSSGCAVGEGQQGHLGGTQPDQAKLKKSLFGENGNLPSKMERDTAGKERTGLVQTKTTLENLERTKEAVANGNPVLIEGATGVGKTATILEVARQCGCRLIRMNMSSRITPDDLLGKVSIKINPSTHKQEIVFDLQPFAVAFQNGDWVLLDELNLAEEKTLQCIEDALDTGRLVIKDTSSAQNPIRVVERHPGFRLFATQNPAAGLFRGLRETLSESFVSRFTLMVYKELTPEEWCEIVEARLQDGCEDTSQIVEARKSIAAEMVQFHMAVQELVVQKTFPEKGGYGTITVRELLRWVDLLCEDSELKENAAHLHERLAMNAWLVYGARFRKEGIKTVLDKMKETKWPIPIFLSGKPPVDGSQTRNLIESARSLGKMHDDDILMGDRWFQNIGESEFPADSTRPATCEATHRKVQELLMGADFILAHGLYDSFSDEWLWHWIRQGTEQDLLDASNLEQLGMLGASLYASRIRHQAARRKITQVFQDSFKFMGVPGLTASVASSPPICLRGRMSAALSLLALALKSKNPILVEGKAGCGKTSCARAFALLCKRRLETVVLTPESDPSVLLGQQMPHSGTSEDKAEVCWTDGPLTRAYKNGQFLLAENLGQAEAAVLERLNAVLENPPMLCLAEKGDSEPLKCTLMSDGSVEEGPGDGYAFLATFTPPGKNSSGFDIQSKELSPALANRFSIVHLDDPCEDPNKNGEVFKEEIRDFAAVYMDGLRDAELRLIGDLCLRIHEVLCEHKAQLPSLTLRSYAQLLDCTYIMQESNPSERRCLNECLWEAYKVTFQVQLRDDDLRERVDGIVDSVLSGATKPVEGVDYLKGLDLPPDLVLTASREVHASAVLACVAANKPVLLEGPPAVGKTALIIGLRKALPGTNKKVERLNNSDSTTLQDYFGSWLPTEAGFVFFKGSLVKAMEEGSWFLADELNLAPISVISSLVPLLEGSGSIQIPGTPLTVTVHPDFRFFATQNSHGTTGRNLLPVNIRNRFLEVQVEDFPQHELSSIILKRFKGSPEENFVTPEVAKQLASLYVNLKESPSPITLREVIKIVKRYTVFSREGNVLSWCHAALSLLLPPHDPESDAHKKVLAAARSVKGWETVVPGRLDWQASVTCLPNGNGTIFCEGPLSLTMPDLDLARSHVWQGKSKPPQAFVRKLVQTAFGLAAGEPLLLVGPSSFKSKLIRAWLDILGRKEDSLTVHVTGETESHDLLGQVYPFSSTELLRQLPVLGLAMHHRYMMVKASTNDPNAVGLELQNVLVSSLPTMIKDFLERMQQTETSDSLDTAEDPSLDFLGNMSVNGEQKSDAMSIDSYYQLDYSLGNIHDNFDGEGNTGSGHEWEVVNGKDGTSSSIELSDGSQDAFCFQDDKDETCEHVQVNQEVTKDVSYIDDENGSGLDGSSDRFSAFELDSTEDILEELPDSPGEGVFALPEDLRALMEDVIAWFDDLLLDVLDNGLDRLVQQFKSIWRMIDGSAKWDRKPIFVFRDGPVLKAVTNGHMLVVEDYDACPQSVTERMNSLLEPDPTFSIPEDITMKSGRFKSGEIEVPNDRFGMIATVHIDDSKRTVNLSAATKSRFTEIAIPRYKEDELSNLLMNELSGRLRYVEEIKMAGTVSRQMLCLRQVLEQEPRVTTRDDIRQLFRWLDFLCNHSAGVELNKRLLTGAKFFFLDELDDLVLQKELATKWWERIGLDPAILPLMECHSSDKPLQCIKREDGSVHEIELTYACVIGKLVESEANDGLTDEALLSRFHCAPTETFLMNMARIFASIAAGSALLLEGPPGIGKTAVVNQAAKLLGAECERINLSKDTMVSHLLGSVMPRFVNGQRVFEWQDGKLVQALKSKKWILLDEINLARQEVLETLIPLLERTAMTFKVPETGEEIPMDGLYVFATMNPASLGGGRSRMPRAVLNMFTIVHLAEHSPRELKIIMNRLFGDLLQKGYLSDRQLESVFDLHEDVQSTHSRRDIGKTGGPYDFNLRDLAKVRDLFAGNIRNQIAHYQLMPAGAVGDSSMAKLEEKSNVHSEVSQIVLRRAAELVYKHRFCDHKDHDRVQELINHHLPKPLLEESSTPTIDTKVPGCIRIGSVYLASQEQQASSGSTRALVHSRETIRQLEMLTTGCQSKRAVLLQGGTCSRKTALVKELARLAGRRLLVISLHQNYETSDLIGQWLPLTSSVGHRRLHEDAVSVIKHISRHVMLYIASGQRQRDQMATLAGLKTAYGYLTGNDDVNGHQGLKQKIQSDMEALKSLKLVLDDACNDGSLPRQVHSISRTMLKALIYTFEKLKNCPISDDDDSIGFVFVESKLVEALKMGDYILLDNINSAPPEVVERLNSLLEEEPVLNLYEHAEGEELRRGNGIDPSARIFATADMKRRSTNKLSSAIINRLITVWLPEMDVDLTEENASMHDLKEIVSTAFCNIPGGSMVAVLCLKVHAAVRKKIKDREIQAVKTAIHWNQQGKPPWSSIVWALWRTYTGALETGSTAVGDALSSICMELSRHPPADFQVISSELGQGDPFQQCQHELQVQMSAVEVLLSLAVSHGLSEIRDNDSFKEVLQMLLLGLLIHVAPADEKLFRDIFQEASIGPMYRHNVLKRLGECGILKDQATDSLADRISDSCEMVHKTCVKLVKETSFTDYEQRHNLLRQVVRVMEKFLGVLHHPAMQALGNRVKSLIDSVTHAAETVAGLRHFFQHYDVFSQLVFTEAKQKFEDSLRDCQEEAALYALNTELSKSILNSKSTLPHVLNRLMGAVGINARPVKMYQLV